MLLVHSVGVISSNVTDNTRSGWKMLQGTKPPGCSEEGDLEFYCFSTQFVIPVKYPSLYHYALFFIVFYCIGSNFDPILVHKQNFNVWIVFCLDLRKTMGGFNV